MATEYVENKDGSVIIKTEQEIPAERLKPILKSRITTLDFQLNLNNKRLAELMLVISEQVKELEKAEELLVKIEAKEKLVTPEPNY
ncbi:MAG: hypothetical protein V1709_08665 [Planctomycetota bacterium]